MTKHWDSIFGGAAMIGTITLAHVNVFIGCCVGLVTLFVMLLRARREWKHRNKPPGD